MIFEYILLGGTLLGAVMGYIKGFLKQISSIVGLVIGYAIASLFLSQIHVLLIEKGIVSDKSSIWISFSIIVFFVFLSIKFLSGIIANIVKNIGLGFTNQFAGIVLGALKYFILIMVLYCFLDSFKILTPKNSSTDLIDFISLFKTVIFKYIV